MNINKHNIFLKENIKSKSELFKFLGRVSNINSWSDTESTVKAFWEREKTQSTGMVSGIVMPHGISEKFKKSHIVIIKLNGGIKWKMLDDSTPQMAFCLFVPQRNHTGGNHLEELQRIASILVDKDIIANLINAKTKEEIVNVLKEKGE